MNLLNLQIRKIFQRTDVKIACGLFGLLPILIAMLIANESKIITIGTSTFSGVGYMTVMLGFLKSLFLLYVLICLFSTSLIAGEIDNGIEHMYLAKIPRREGIILPKLGAMSVLVVALFGLILASSAAGWGIFIRGSEYGSLQFLSEKSDENMLLLLYVGLSFLETLVLIGVTALAALFFSQAKAFIISFVYIILSKVLANVEGVQNLLPTYLGDGKGLFELVGRDLFYGGLKDGGILLFYVVLFVGVILLRYRKMDLIR